MRFRHLAVTVLFLSQALALLAAPLRSADAKEVYRLSLPDRDWAMTLTAPNLRLGVIEHSLRFRNGTPVAYFMGEDPPNHRIVSAWIQPAEGAVDAEACRKMLWYRTEHKGVRKTIIKEAIRGEWKTVEYTATKKVRKAKSRRLNRVYRSRHLRAYIAKENVCIDVNITDLSGGKKSTPSLSTTLDAISLEPVEEKGVRQFPVATGEGNFAIQLPPTWQTEMHEPKKGKHTTINIRPYRSKNFLIRLTAMPLTATRMVHNSKYSLRNWLKESADRYLPTSIESKIELKELEIEDGFGYYMQLTDKKPKDKAARRKATPVWNTGMAWVGDLFVIFSIFTHEGDTETVDQGIKLITGARHILNCEHGINRGSCIRPQLAKNKPKQDKKEKGFFDSIFGK